MQEPEFSSIFHEVEYGISSSLSCQKCPATDVTDPFSGTPKEDLWLEGCFVNEFTEHPVYFYKCFVVGALSPGAVDIAVANDKVFVGAGTAAVGVAGDGGGDGNVIATSSYGEGTVVANVILCIDGRVAAAIGIVRSIIVNFREAVGNAGIGFVVVAVSYVALGGTVNVTTSPAFVLHTSVANRSCSVFE